MSKRPFYDDQQDADRPNSHKRSRTDPLHHPRPSPYISSPFQVRQPTDPHNNGGRGSNLPSSDPPLPYRHPRPQPPTLSSTHTAWRNSRVHRPSANHPETSLIRSDRDKSHVRNHPSLPRKPAMSTFDTRIADMIRASSTTFPFSSTRPTGPPSTSISASDKSIRPHIAPASSSYFRSDPDAITHWAFSIDHPTPVSKTNALPDRALKARADRSSQVDIARTQGTSSSSPFASTNQNRQLSISIPKVSEVNTVHKWKKFSQRLPQEGGMVAQQSKAARAEASIQQTLGSVSRLRQELKGLNAEIDGISMAYETRPSAKDSRQTIITPYKIERNDLHWEFKDKEKMFKILKARVAQWKRDVEERNDEIGGMVNQAHQGVGLPVARANAIFPSKFNAPKQQLRLLDGSANSANQSRGMRNLSHVSHVETFMRSWDKKPLDTRRMQTAEQSARKPQQKNNAEKRHSYHSTYAENTDSHLSDEIDECPDPEDGELVEVDGQRAIYREYPTSYALEEEEEEWKPWGSDYGGGILTTDDPGAFENAWFRNEYGENEWAGEHIHEEESEFEWHILKKLEEEPDLGGWRFDCSSAKPIGHDEVDHYTEPTKGDMMFHDASKRLIPRWLPLMCRGKEGDDEEEHKECGLDEWDGLGCHEFDGFGAADDDGFGVADDDGFGVADDDGFGVADDDGFGVADDDGFGEDDDGFGVADDDGFMEVDLEGYGCEDYEGCGIQDDDGFGVEDDDGVFLVRRMDE